MTAALHLPDVARDAGLKIRVLVGWDDRGYGFDPRGGVAHHTGNKAGTPIDAVLTVGRPDLKGPLSQWSTWPDGTITIIAAGRANHAGKDHADNPLIRFGARANRYVYGDEMVHTGRPDTPWPAIQLESAQAMWAAVFAFHGWTAERLVSHHEWAGPRKPDPVGIDMDDFRASVDRILNPPSSHSMEDIMANAHQIIAASEANREIYHLYKSLLRREPDPDGYIWACRLYVRADGVADDVDADREARLEAVARHIRASAEYKRLHQ